MSKQRPGPWAVCVAGVACPTRNTIKRKGDAVQRDTIGDKERLFLSQARARAGTRFTFGGRTAPTTINNLLRAGAIERVPQDDPYWSPGLFRFTRTGARIANESTAATREHHITIVPSPKMDAQELFAAVCSCGLYRSAPTSKYAATKRGMAHVFNIGARP